MGKFLFQNRGWIPVLPILVAVATCRTFSFGTLAGLSLIPVGLFIRLWAIFHIGPAARSRKITAPKLIYTGPYELSRNPLYIANIMIYTGIGISTHGVSAGAAVALLSSVYYSIITRYEESELERRLGEAYRSYLNRVPRWLGESAPVHAAAPKGSPEERMVSGLRAERSTLGAAFLIICAVLLRSTIAG